MISAIQVTTITTSTTTVAVVVANRKRSKFDFKFNLMSFIGSEKSECTMISRRSLSLKPSVDKTPSLPTQYECTSTKNLFVSPSN